MPSKILIILVIPAAAGGLWLVGLLGSLIIAGDVIDRDQSELFWSNITESGTLESEVVPNILPRSDAAFVEQGGAVVIACSPRLCERLAGLSSGDIDDQCDQLVREPWYKLDAVAVTRNTNDFCEELVEMFQRRCKEKDFCNTLTRDQCRQIIRKRVETSKSLKYEDFKFGHGYDCSQWPN